MLEELRGLLRRAREEPADYASVLQRLSFLERGLRWTEIEARLHAFFRSDVPPDKAAVRKLCDERFAMMREIFQKEFLALNVAAISWGEDGALKRFGWTHPRPPAD